MACKQLIGYVNTRVKKYHIFSRVLLRLFSGPEILVQYRSLCDKINDRMLLIRKVAPFKIIPLQKDSLTIIPFVSSVLKRQLKLACLKAMKVG